MQILSMILLAFSSATPTVVAPANPTAPTNLSAPRTDEGDLAAPAAVSPRPARHAVQFRIPTPQAFYHLQGGTSEW